tara:strand:- start:31 stop:591 length:561 start_codon:yes stop_codon:yes gene_type:complete
VYFLLFFLTIFLVNHSYALPTSVHPEYQRLESVVKIGHTQKIDINGLSVTYYGSSADESKIILDRIAKSIKLLAVFYKDSNNTCLKRNLLVYHIDDNVLNDRDVMHFLDWNAWGNKSLNGVYDGRMAPENYGTIFITRSVSGEKLDRLIAHETSHFWQHTRCIKVGENRQRESDASRFELFYLSRQ